MEEKVASSREICGLQPAHFSPCRQSKSLVENLTTTKSAFRFVPVSGEGGVPIDRSCDSIFVSVRFGACVRSKDRLAPLLN